MRGCYRRGDALEETGKPDRATFNLLMRLRPFGDFDGLTPDEMYAYMFDAFDPAASPISFNEEIDPGLIANVGFHRDIVGCPESGAATEAHPERKLACPPLQEDCGYGFGRAGWTLA